MKKSIFIFFTIALLLFPGVTLLGQSARTIGMGGAFTSVADDYNTLFYNPAGLAYIEDSQYFASGLGVANFNSEFITGSGYYEYPDIYSDYDYDTGELYYYYYDEFTSMPTYFDPADWGFSYSSQAEYEQACQEYENLLLLHDTYRTFSELDSLKGATVFGMVDKNWGIARTDTFFITPVMGEFTGHETPLTLNMTRINGTHGGFGFDLGNIAIGAKAAYKTYTYYNLYHTVGDFEYGPPEGFSIIPGDYVEEFTSFELGVGAMYKEGSITFGATIDNALILTNEGDGRINLLENLNIGASFNPFQDFFLLNFITAADIKNLGSEDYRTLNIGVEAELDIVIMDGTLRGGYIQPLPGSINDIAFDLDPTKGIVTAGIGLRAFFATANFAVEAPLEAIMETTNYNSDDKVSYTLDLTISF